MTTALAPARPAASAGRATFAALAARETRRFALNPVFLLAVALTAYALWSGQRSTVTDIDNVNPIAAVFLCVIAVLVALLRGAEGRCAPGSSVPWRSRARRP